MKKLLFLPLVIASVGAEAAQKNPRITAARKAGLKKIDTLVTTHFHGDHYGALQALAKMIPIGTFMDHGESVEIARSTSYVAN